jgi:hypothetical protein
MVLLVKLMLSIQKIYFCYVKISLEKDVKTEKDEFCERLCV